MTARYSETKAPVDEVAEQTTIERAIYDARWDFKGILGEGHYSERDRSLYMLRGTEVNRARNILSIAVHEDKIRYGDIPRTYVEKLQQAATRALVAVRLVRITTTNEKRLDNVIARLEGVVTYTAKATTDDETARALKISRELSRFPEDADRAQEIQVWGMCLTKALDIIQFLGGDPNADGEGIWDWSPEALATHFSDAREEHENYRDELGDMINALDDGNVQGAWMLMYDFAKERKGADS